MASLSLQKMWSGRGAKALPMLKFTIQCFIAAAFCMYNRYVDGLDTWQPRDAGMYAQMGPHLAEHGYLKPSR